MLAAGRARPRAERGPGLRTLSCAQPRGAGWGCESTERRVAPGLRPGCGAEPSGAQLGDTVPCRAARRRPLPRRMRGRGRRGGKRAVPPRSAQPRRGRRAAPARARYGAGGQGRHGVPVPREGVLGHGVLMTGSALAPGGLPETDVREEPPPRPGYRGYGGE